MIDNLWAYWALAYAAFWLGAGHTRILNSRWLRERKIWDGDTGELILATPEEIEAAKRLDICHCPFVGSRT